MLKLNVDDASCADVGWVGLGVVGRDSNGTILFSAVRRTKAYWSPKIAEAKSIAMAIRLGKGSALVMLS